MLMKRLALLLLAFFLPGLALDCSKYVQTDCGQFTQNAQNYTSQATASLDDKTLYTLYIGAADEYDKAGKCSECTGKTYANSYNDALTNYFKVPPLLTPGGDFGLRGETYEKIGDAYNALHNTQNATHYYELAEAEYILESPTDVRLTGLTAKKAALSQAETQTQPPAGTDFTTIILSIAVAAGLVVAGLFVYANKDRFRRFPHFSYPPEPRRPEPHEPEPPRREYPSEHKPEPDTTSTLEKTSGPRSSSDNTIKQKLRDKIRGKYGL